MENTIIGHPLMLFTSRPTPHLRWKKSQSGMVLQQLFEREQNCDGVSTRLYPEWQDVETVEE